MRFRKLRWTTAALIAFVMGVPMAERALADDGGFFAFGGAGGIGGIVGAALALASSIVDTAGGS